jgi:DNA-directed RNA polymerase omega subunit
MKHTSNEELLHKIPNRFELVLIAAHRTKELMHEYPSKIPNATGSPATIALDEIQAGYIGREYLSKLRKRNFK